MHFNAGRPVARRRRRILTPSASLMSDDDDDKEDFQIDYKPKDVKAYLDAGLCDQAGRGEEGRAERGVVRSLSPAGGVRGQGDSELREAKYHPYRADGCGQNVFDTKHRGADRRRS